MKTTKTDYPNKKTSALNMRICPDLKRRLKEKSDLLDIAQAKIVSNGIRKELDYLDKLITSI